MLIGQEVGRHESSVGGMCCVEVECTLLDEMCVEYEATVGKNHPDYAKTISNMAEVYRKKGEYDRALEMFEEAQVVYEVRS